MTLRATWIVLFLLLSALLLAACDPSDGDEVDPEQPTATAPAASTPVVPTATPSPAFDIEATIQAGIQATIAAQPTPTPAPTQTPSPTPVPTAAPEPLRVGYGAAVGLVVVLQGGLPGHVGRRRNLSGFLKQMVNLSLLYHAVLTLVTLTGEW